MKFWKETSKKPKPWTYSNRPSSVPGAPKEHELPEEFGIVWVFEKLNPPPVPGAVFEHVLGIDLPYVIEDFVHGMLHFSLLFQSV